MPPLSIVLVHHPVLDREGGIVTTALTNLDLHDMSRSARSYGVDKMFVVHPIEAQRNLAARIRTHWVDGSGKKRIPDRPLALEIVQIVPDLETVFTQVGGSRQGVSVWTTAASDRHGNVVPYANARAELAEADRPVLLLFGTGWGLSGELLADADRRLAPIEGNADDGYNHLSVRAACAISLDRLLG